MPRKAMTSTLGLASLDLLYSSGMSHCRAAVVDPGEWQGSKKERERERER
jgi:hypothetical protein